MLSAQASPGRFLVCCVCHFAHLNDDEVLGNCSTNLKQTELHILYVKKKNNPNLLLIFTHEFNHAFGNEMRTFLLYDTVQREAINYVRVLTRLPSIASLIRVFTKFETARDDDA